MAIIKNGRLSGRVGNQLFYVRNGVQCVRAMPKKRKDTPSPARLLHLAKMRLVVTFLLPLKDIVKYTCKPPNDRMTGMNRALQQVYREALMEENGIPKIDLSRVKVSRGATSGCMVHSVNIKQGKVVVVDWQTSSFNAYHQLFVVVYNTDQQLVQLSNGGALVREGQLELELNEEMREGTVHLYLYASDRLGKTFSQSEYLGRFEV